MNQKEINQIIQIKSFDEMSEEAEFATVRLGIDCEIISKESFREKFYNAPHQHGAVLQRPGFGLHPLKYCLGLAKAAAKHGAILHGHSKVQSWAKQNGAHVITTQSGGILKANHVFVCCNGFLDDDLHDSLAGRALPLQSQIIVTRPLSADERAAHNWITQNPAINSRNVYFYYRMLPDNRFLIGGRGDFKGTREGAEKTTSTFKASFNRFWPEWQHVEIEYSWRGFVCFTRRFTPTIGRLPNDPSIHFAFGYHGNGVNNATWAGRELAQWLATGNDLTAVKPDHLPAIVRGIPKTFPFPNLRPVYARIGVEWEHLKDRMQGVL